MIQFILSLKSFDMILENYRHWKDLFLSLSFMVTIIYHISQYYNECFMNIYVRCKCYSVYKWFLKDIKYRFIYVYDLKCVNRKHALSFSTSSDGLCIYEYMLFLLCEMHLYADTQCTIYIWGLRKWKGKHKDDLKTIFKILIYYFVYNLWFNCN